MAEYGREIRGACREQDFERAATVMLEVYGDEIHSFLVAYLRSEGDADAAFAQFADDLSKTLPRVRDRDSLRGWAYAVATNAAHTVTTERDSAGQSEVKSRLAALRDQLGDDDRLRLLLHVDRALRWHEVSLVMSGK